MRYLAHAGGRPVAAFGFGAAAWSLGPRDRWIGWTWAEREAHSPLVADLHRFLVLRWVSVPCHASHLLGRVLRRLPADWVGRHGLHPVLLETFVEADRFAGTCYVAANWRRVGRSRGRGRMDRGHRRPETVKDVWLYRGASMWPGRTSACRRTAPTACAFTATCYGTSLADRVAPSYRYDRRQAETAGDGLG